MIDAFDFRHVGEWIAGLQPRRAGARTRPGHVVPDAAARLPDDPLLHACVVAYASDLTLLGTATLPHPIGRRRTPGS